MWRGLYTAATGMMSELKRTDAIANNIANAATTRSQGISPHAY